MKKAWIALGMAAALILPTARTVVAHQSRPAPTHEYVVRPGDTLWRIAEREGFSGDRRAAVERIIELNDGLDPVLHAGQVIELPGA